MRREISYIENETLSAAKGDKLTPKPNYTRTMSYSAFSNANGIMEQVLFLGVQRGNW